MLWLKGHRILRLLLTRHRVSKIVSIKSVGVQQLYLDAHRTRSCQNGARQLGRTLEAETEQHSILANTGAVQASE